MRARARRAQDLVLLETTPAVIVGIPTRQDDDDDDERSSYDAWNYFGPTLRSMHKNYHALFRHFSLLNFWLSLFDQTMVILPYVAAAPLLFADDPANRLTLGTLVKVSNSFGKVFSSLSVIAESWGDVNSFRSVYRRLREFERKLYLHRPRKKRNNCLLLLPVRATPLAPPLAAPPPLAGAQRRESSRSRSRSRSSSSSEASSGGRAHTELVGTPHDPVAVHTTYGGTDGAPEARRHFLNDRYDMNV